MANFDVIIIGAGTNGFTVTGTRRRLTPVCSGLSGIAASRFYLDIHPNCRLAILEEDACVEGVWSARGCALSISQDADFMRSVLQPGFTMDFDREVG